MLLFADMSLPDAGKRSSIVFWLALVFAVLAVVAIVALVAAEVYVRWKVNQNFTFLGGYKFEALAISASALLIGLAHANRNDPNN